MGQGKKEFLGQQKKMAFFSVVDVTLKQKPVASWIKRVPRKGYIAITMPLSLVKFS